MENERGGRRSSLWFGEYIVVEELFSVCFDGKREKRKLLLNVLASLVQIEH